MKPKFNQQQQQQETTQNTSTINNTSKQNKLKTCKTKGENQINKN